MLLVCLLAHALVHTCAHVHLLHNCNFFLTDSELESLKSGIPSTAEKLRGSCLTKLNKKYLRYQKWKPSRKFPLWIDNINVNTVKRVKNGAVSATGIRALTVVRTPPFARLRSAKAQRTHANDTSFTWSLRSPSLPPLRVKKDKNARQKNSPASGKVWRLFSVLYFSRAHSKWHIVQW